MENIHHLIQEIIQFLSENEYILTSHITEAYTKDYFSNIPNDWFTSLEDFSYTEYLQILSHVDKVFFYIDFFWISSVIFFKS